MESKVTTREKIISCFKDGQTIAIGGQTGHWMPERLIDCILESGARHLTVYSIDTSDPGVGIGPPDPGEGHRPHHHHPCGYQPGYQRTDPGWYPSGGVQPYRQLDRAHPLRRYGTGRRSHQNGTWYRGGGGQAAHHRQRTAVPAGDRPPGGYRHHTGPPCPTPSAIWPTGAALAGPPTPSWPPAGTCPLWSATTSAIWERSHPTR